MRDWRKDRHKDTCTEKLELDDLCVFQSGEVPTKQVNCNLSTLTMYSPAGRTWLVSVGGLPSVAISGCVHQRGGSCSWYFHIQTSVSDLTILWAWSEKGLVNSHVSQTLAPCNDTHSWRAFCCCCSVELSLLPKWKEMTNYILILLLTACVNDYITSQCLSFSINQIKMS